MADAGKRPYLENVGRAGALAQLDGNHDVAPTTAALYIAANANRSSIVIRNNGTQIIYVSTRAGVTVADGMPIAVGAEREMRTIKAIYAISASGTQDTRYWEESAA